MAGWLADTAPLPSPPPLSVPAPGGGLATSMSNAPHTNAPGKDFPIFPGPAFLFSASTEYLVRACVAWHSTYICMHACKGRAWLTDRGGGWCLRGPGLLWCVADLT
jgi:hypothetical protein